MFNHLLVPLDGSHLAEAALPAVMALANKFDSEITLANVIQPPHIVMTAANGTVYMQLLSEMRQQAKQEADSYINSHQGSLRQQGFTVQSQIVEGEDIAGALLEVAASKKIDTIVMSTHGRGGISRWVFGSIADKVLRHATMPVLLIRAKEEKGNEECLEAEMVA